MKLLRKLSKTKQQMLVLVGLLTTMAGAGLWLFWIKASLERLSANSKKSEQLQSQILELENKAKLDAQNQPLLEQMMAFVRPLGETMLLGDPYMWTVRELRQREDHLPVKIVSIRQGNSGPHLRRGGYEVYTVGLEVEGTYDQIGQFLSGLENEFPTSEFRRLELSAADPTLPQRRANLQLAFLVYPEAKMGPRTPAKGESAK